MPKRATEPLSEVLPGLLAERQLSLRRLADHCQVDVSFLSRVLRHENGKVAGPDLATRVARALNLPDDYFIEARRGKVIEQLNQSPELVDQIYAQLRRT